MPPKVSCNSTRRAWTLGRYAISRWLDICWNILEGYVAFGDMSNMLVIRRSASNSTWLESLIVDRWNIQSKDSKVRLSMQNSGCIKQRCSLQLSLLVYPRDPKDEPRDPKRFCSFFFCLISGFLFEWDVGMSGCCWQSELLPLALWESNRALSPSPSPMELR